MENVLYPQKLKIIKINKISDDLKSFWLTPVSGKFALNQNGQVFVPGQFILAGVWGYGEIPLGICSSLYEQTYIQVVVRKVGNVSSAIHRLKLRDEITFRGPYGKGYPLEFFHGKDVVMITGGSGIPPLAALAEYIIAKRKNFDRVYLLYGAKNPDELILKERYPLWQKSIKVILTIDKPAPNWHGHIGLVSNLTKEIEISPKNTVAAMCGPGPMADALENILKPLGVSDRRIFISEERKISCGIGKCQHCTTGDKYVCIDGPVFYYDQIQNNWD